MDEDETEITPGTVLGDRYELLAPVVPAPEPGSAPRWRARDRRLQRPVVIALPLDEPQRAGVVDEAGGVAVGRLLDGGEHAGQAYVVFEALGAAGPGAAGPPVLLPGDAWVSGAGAWAATATGPSVTGSAVPAAAAASAGPAPVPARTGGRVVARSAAIAGLAIVALVAGVVGVNRWADGTTARVPGDPPTTPATVAVTGPAPTSGPVSTVAPTTAVPTTAATVPTTAAPTTKPAPTTTRKRSTTTTTKRNPKDPDGRVGDPIGDGD